MDASQLPNAYAGTARPFVSSTFCFPTKHPDVFFSLHSIRKQLTVDEFKCYHESADWFQVPRYYGIKMDLWKDRTVNTLTYGAEIPLDHAQFDAKLDEKKFQVSSTNQCQLQMKENKGCILVLPCGLGKTACAISLISHYKRKTLIVVQSNELLQQTAVALRRFMPKATVGIIQGPPSTWTTDVDIVVAMMQTLYLHRDQIVSDSFGFVIVDECHHIGAPTFMTVLQKFRPQYMLGLTATPQRMDNKTKWLEWMIGPIVNVLEHKSMTRGDIEVSWSPELPSSYPRGHLTQSLYVKDQKERVILYTLAQWDHKRRAAQVQYINEYLPTASSSSPQMVIFGERILQLCMISYELHKLRDPTFFHKEMDDLLKWDGFQEVDSVRTYWKHSPRNLKKEWAATQKSYLKFVNSQPLNFRVLSTAKSKLDRPILFATIRKLGEGIDVSTLETVCLSSSISANNLGQFAQVVGRLRPKDGVKKRILEFSDPYVFFAQQAKKRKQFYNERGMKQI